MDNFQKYLADNADTVQVFHFNRNATSRSSSNRRGSWNRREEMRRPENDVRNRPHQNRNSHRRRPTPNRKLKYEVLKLKKELAKEKQKNIAIEPQQADEMDHEQTEDNPPVEPQSQQTSISDDVPQTSTVT